MKAFETISAEPPADVSAVDSLAVLHTRTVDALAGYETMVEKAEPSFRPTAEQFRTLHADHAVRLARLLSDLGATPDQDGSFMATVNKVVVSARAFFDEIDADVMDSIRSGEAHVIDAFSDALHAGLPQHVQSPVAEMRDELSGLLAETRLVR